MLKAKKVSKEMISSSEDIAKLFCNIAVRDFVFTVRLGYDKPDMIHIYRPCVLREHDRKYYTEPYHSYDELKYSEEKTDRYSYYGLEYGAKVSRFTPAIKVSHLEGWYEIPHLPIPRSVFLEMVIRFCAKLELHELQENFYYDGERIFDPHGEWDEMLYEKVITVNWST